MYLIYTTRFTTVHVVRTFREETHSAIIHSTSGDQPLRVVAQHPGTSFITRVEKCLPF
jgi:hypothetical protein